MTKEEIEKKETKNKLVIGIVLVIIMVLSTLGYAILSSEKEISREKLEYNGIKFTQTEGGYWQFQAQGISFLTQYAPKDTENISSAIFIGPGNYAGKTLYFIGEEAPSKSEIILNFNGRLVSRVQPGSVCLKANEDKCNNDTPVKDCSTDNIIIIEESNETKITQDENCVTIAAPYQEQARAADAFIFKILGVQ